MTVTTRSGTELIKGGIELNDSVCSSFFLNWVNFCFRNPSLNLHKDRCVYISRFVLQATVADLQEAIHKRSK